MLFHLHLISQKEIKDKVEINILLKEMKAKEKLAMINGGGIWETQPSAGNSWRDSHMTEGFSKRALKIILLSCVLFLF